VGATALVIHAIVPRTQLIWDPVERQELLERCAELLRAYVAAAQRHHLVPTLENVPPVLRMREARYLYTPVGMSPEDLVWFLERAPGLQATLDVSHAQLYVNAQRWEALPAEAAVPALAPLRAYVRHFPPVPAVDMFVDALGGWLFEAHISNARGLLGEGLPYGEGDLDLDRLVARLARQARYLVTETLEPDPERAVFMREAQARMAAVVNQLDARTP
jgi:sugar phosphate isomerase/epimerase